MGEEKRKPSLFWLLAAVILPVSGLLFRFRIRGSLPESGPFILAPNHNSEADPVIVGVAVWKAGRAPRFMAKESLFKIPVVGWLLRATGQIPVSRDRRTGNAQALESANELVRLGRGVIVYPEGTLTREPALWPMKGRGGAVRLALASGIPIYPVAQWGVQRFFPRYAKGIRLGFRMPIDINIGEPLDLSPFEGRTHSASAINEATNLLMERISELLGELREETPPETVYVPDASEARRSGRDKTPKAPALETPAEGEEKAARNS